MKTTQNHDSGAPIYRPLKVYAFDPSQGRNIGNYMTVNVKYEKLQPGPIGEHLMVIDYDASNRCYYLPVDPDDPAILLRGGLDPSESNPQFHQQMAYAVASETIKRFEFALGRPIKWGFRGGVRNDPNRRRLRIFPHAMQEANAYYSRDLRALVFGYFRASETDAGSNLPGQTVFTCLSHDIIVHETTHALIDGQRDFFTEPTGFDTPAFHEAFADIIALFQHFSFKEALLETIQRTGGRIYKSDIEPETQPANRGPTIQAELSTGNPMVGLAKQFGEAMGMRAALRSALGTPPNSNDLDKLFEPHSRGSILVAAVFDAFFTVYLRRTRDLMRIARAGGAMTGPGELHPDLANRLAAEAAKTASHFVNMCIRALDYCPPVDILFGDFLRAMITADCDLVPDDDLGYRAALIEAFRLRGVRPEYVVSYSEESLRWCGPMELYGKDPRCEGLIFDLVKGTSPEQMKENARVLSNFGKNNARWLGLSTKEPVQAHSFHPVHRVGPDGQLKIEIVAELMQQRKLALDPKDKSSPDFTFRGGSTLVLDRDGHARYAIQKSLESLERLARQREYHLQLSANLGVAPYSGRPPEAQPMSFNLVHRGY